MDERIATSCTDDREIPISQVMLWAATFAMLLCVTRGIVLFVFVPDPVSYLDVVASIFRFPGHFLFGTILAIVWWRARNRLTFILGALLVFIFVVLNLAVIHYEAGFGSLPSVTATRLLSQLEFAGASVAAQAPLVWIITELVLILSVLGGLRLLAGRVAPRKSTRPIQITTVALVVLSSLAVVAGHIEGNGISPKFFWVTKHPILWFFQGMLETAANPEVGGQDVRSFQAWLGHQPPFADIDSAFPLCAPRPRGPELPGNRRSVILLILESVGQVETTVTYQDQEVMPNLKRVANENFSEKRMVAAGEFSGGALVALTTGVPPQTAGHFLYRQPLNTFDGLPRTLRERGYRTAFLHGSDLAFEQQAPFLEMVGFEEILDRSYFGGELKGDAWGLPDGDMLVHLQDWISAIRNHDETTPYFTALTTISSHHPYGLPPSWRHTFTGSDQLSDFYESLHYLDHELASFFAWYLKNEAPRGTLLVMVGDHAPQIAMAQSNRRRAGYRFDVACVIAGIGPETKGLWPDWSQRTASQFDLPATLRGLLEIEPGRCDQGVNLLLPANEWPHDRLTYAVGGADRRIVQVWSDRSHSQLDRRTGVFEILRTSHMDDDQVQQHADEILDFLRVALAVNAKLYSENAYAPRLSLPLNIDPLPAIQKPIVASHRGSVAGMLPVARQNRMDEIKEAVKAGFEWVEVDTMITADKVVVLNHDWHVTDDAGNEHLIFDLSLAEIRSLPGLASLPTLAEILGWAGEEVGVIIEAKKQQYVDADVALAEGICALVENRDQGTFIVDSLSPNLSGMINTFCDCPVGLDVPTTDEIGIEWIDAANLAHFEWLFVHHLAASPKLIETAHQNGIRVMIFPVSDPTQLERFEGQWPDGIIADHVDIKHEIDLLEDRSESPSRLQIANEIRSVIP